ncbi:MAG TPA: glycine cleavage system protein GcvH [Actinomycetota bacterium]|nr:glycine cleavage system protein GcvH [Actinomycetota bacterium]
MTEFPDDRRYTREHEWAREADGHIVVGITDYAQEQLGDIVEVELPDPGAQVTAGAPLGEVESTKSIADVYSPVSGQVAETNADVKQSPELINTDPYGRGWLMTVRGAPGQLEELMAAADYRSFVSGEEIAR